MADLHLNLNGEYFDQIKAGTKPFEYRLAAKWLRRLEGKSFDRVFCKRGYPKSGDQERIIERPWLCGASRSVCDTGKLKRKI